MNKNRTLIKGLLPVDSGAMITSLAAKNNSRLPLKCRIKVCRYTTATNLAALKVAALVKPAPLSNGIERSPTLCGAGEERPHPIAYNPLLRSPPSAASARLSGRQTSIIRIFDNTYGH